MCNIIFILYLKKPRRGGKGREVVQDHTGSKWHNPHLRPKSSPSKLGSIFSPVAACLLEPLLLPSGEFCL